MHFYLKTYGCQMNVYDSVRIKNLLAPLDYSETGDMAEADLILFNTCTVREKAKHKFLSELGRLKENKEKNQDLIIGVGGCVAQEEGERLLKKAPHLDLVFGVDQIDRLPALIEQIKAQKERLVLTAFDTDPKLSLSYLQGHKSSVSSYVTVMMGCDKHCSFCIVPFTRGREKSRSPREILQEIELMVQKGTKEVTLLGQNVNSYRCQDVRFPELLGLVSQIDGLKRIRFTSPHPQDFCNGMIACYAALPNLCRHLHLPVQSGNNDVLKKMFRFYSIEHYKERIDALRQRVTGIAITTDIIVGFPGETVSQYEDTLNLLREIRYDSIYSFKYSPRTGTKASKKYQDDIPEVEKERRLSQLQSLQDAISLEINQAQVGQSVEALVEKISKKGHLQGRTDTNKLVHFPGDSSLIGCFTEVEIKQAFPHSFLGKINKGRPISFENGPAAQIDKIR